MKLILLVIMSVAAIMASSVAMSANYAVGGSILCGLEDGGDVNCVTDWGYSRLDPPANIPGLTSIVAGDVHACGLTQTGAAYCWGDNDFGQLNAPTDVQFMQISAGNHITCGVATDNQAHCWGLDRHGETTPPEDERFSQVAAYSNTSCGIKLDGDISCWGQFGLLEELNKLAPFINVELGRDRVCGLTAGNQYTCTLSPNQPDTMAILNGADVAVSNDLICSLNSNGDISCSARNWPSQTLGMLDVTLNQINDGPTVLALYGGKGVSARMCYSTEDGGFGCLFPEFDESPLQAGDGSVDIDAPFNLRAAVYSESMIELLWEITDEYGTVVGADIYRDGVLLDTTTNRTSYIDDTLSPGVDYEYAVASYSHGGERGPISEAVIVNTAQNSDGDPDSDYEPANGPMTPTGLRADIYNQNELELFWNRSDSVHPDFLGYEIWRNHEFHAFTYGISFYDDKVKPNSSYNYTVVAVAQDGSILSFAGLEVKINQ